MHCKHEMGADILLWEKLLEVSVTWITKIDELKWPKCDLILVS